jgi:hypothetical protein
MTAISQTEIVERTPNPLDVVEEVVSAFDWSFERPSVEEMLAEVAGRWGTYRLFFYWQEDVAAMQFSCQFDMTVPDDRAAEIVTLLSMVNERMWLGHFDVDADDSTPMFRHTLLLRGTQGATIEQIEDLVDVAVTECERFFPAFQFVMRDGKTAEDAVSAAILDIAGEA